MKQFLKDMSCNIGIGLPFFMLFSHDLLPRTSGWFIVYGMIIAICINMTVWGLKKDK